MVIGSISESDSSQQSCRASAENDLAQQVQRLNCRVASLEKELAASQQKCGHYREFVTRWALTQHSQEELERWAMDDDLTNCLPLEQFIGDLEAIVDKHN